MHQASLRARRPLVSATHPLAAANCRGNRDALGSFTRRDLGSLHSEQMEKARAPRSSVAAGQGGSKRGRRARQVVALRGLEEGRRGTYRQPLARAQQGWPAEQQAGKGARGWRSSRLAGSGRLVGLPWWQGGPGGKHDPGARHASMLGAAASISPGRALRSIKGAGGQFVGAQREGRPSSFGAGVAGGGCALGLHCWWAVDLGGGR
jgi:hypothetical protein